MEFEKYFTTEICQEILNRTAESTPLEKTVTNYEILQYENEDIVRLSISTSDVTYEYVLVKSTNKAEKIKTAPEDLVTFVPDDYLTLNNDCNYAVFGEKCLSNFSLPRRMDIDHLKRILETLSKYHKQHLQSQIEHVSKHSIVLDIELLITNCKSMSLKVNLNQMKLQLERLVQTINQLLENQQNYLVPSVKHVLFHYNGTIPVDCLLITTETYYMPPAFDVLRNIFRFTTERESRRHFRDLVEFYFVCISDEKYLPKNYFDKQVATLIPYVKILNITKELQKEPAKNDLSSLLEYVECPNINREDCYEIIDKKMLGSDFPPLNYFKLIPLVQKYGNFGDYYVLKIGVHIEEMEFFAKYLPRENEAVADMIKNGPVRKEDFFYKTMIKLFEAYNLYDLLNFAPKCYLSRVGDILVLEHLDPNRYRIRESQQFYDYDLLRLASRRIAEFHACSLIFEELKSAELGKKYTIGDEYGEYLKETLFQSEIDDDLKFMSDKGLETITDYIIHQYPEIIKNLSTDEFIRRAKLAFKSFYIKVLTSPKHRNVICHGDLWTTNIMFKFDEDLALDCKIVDFQLIRYCPPTQDLLFFIYANTTKETRTKYMSSILQGYHEHLSKTIRKHVLDVDTVYPYQEFQESCDYIKSQALIQALLYSQFNLAKTEDRQTVFSNKDKFDYYLKVDRISFVSQMMDKYPIYKKVMGELIEDLYEICEKNEF